MEQLNFQLPDFTRVSWVSTQAQAVWGPRLQSISKAWESIEWKSVYAGIRKCCLVTVTPQDYISKSALWAEHGLFPLPLQMQAISQYTYSSSGAQAQAGEPFAYRVVVGSIESVLRFKEAYKHSNDREIGNLLGFPDCCTDFFERVWVKQGRIDTTWDMAQNSKSHQREKIHHIDIEDSDPVGSILWRWMGIRTVPHLPCSFHCQKTQAFANDLLNLGRASDFGQEIDWLLEILSWSVEWSALHGIAEIKTPILKVSTRTDATPIKYTVRRIGEEFPKEGASGLDFPFRIHQIRLITDSKLYQAGLKNPIPKVIATEPVATASASPAVSSLVSTSVSAPIPAPIPAQWLAIDNGFSSIVEMDRAHKPLVALITSIISGTQAYNVLDLGCGNGALLSKLLTAHPHSIPFGIEKDNKRFKHIAEMLPAFSQNFSQGNMFTDETLWREGRLYKIGILMPGRLLEVETSQAEWLRKRIKQYCENIIVYAYGDWLTKYGTLEALAIASGLKLTAPTEANSTVSIAMVP